MELKTFNELLKDGDYVAWDEAMDQKISLFMRQMLPLLRAKKMDDFWMSLFFPDFMKHMMTTVQVPKAIQRKIWRAMIARARDEYAGSVETEVPDADVEDLGDSEIMGEE